MYQQKLGHGEAVNCGVEESCDEAAIDLHGSYPHGIEESDYGDGVNVVYMYSNIGHPCSACQWLPLVCMLCALHCKHALLARIR